MGKSKVAIVKGPEQPGEKQIDTTVRKAIELAGGLTDIVSPGDTVLIKPNLVWASPPETGTTTDPRICKTIANMVRELGAKPIIAESSIIASDTEEVIKVAGYGKLREEGYQVIDLKKKGIEMVKVPIPKGKVLKEVSLPKIVLDADVIISVPKMKTHDSAKVTLSLKNMKGVLPDTYKRKLHHVFGVFQGVADLCTLVKPAFAVVDGIIGMEGLGPADGEPVAMGLIIAGKDLVAVDTVTSAVMGFEKEEYGCIDAAAKAGLGTADLSEIDVVGEPISKVQRRFKRVEEAMAEMPFPAGFQLIMDERTCSGCRNIVTEVLMAVKDANQLDRAAGWAVIAGKLEKLPDVDRGKLLLVGVCTAKFRNEGIFIEGCPPNNRDVVRGMSGMGIDVVTGIDISVIDAMGEV